jgi:UDP-glucose 4-epimerase
MMFADTRDIADAVVLAVDAPRAQNATMFVGPDEATPLDAAVALLAARTRLPVVRANMPGPAVNYTTSNARARELLGFRPRWSFAAMIEDAFAGRC